MALAVNKQMQLSPIGPQLSNWLRFLFLIQKNDITPEAHAQ